MNPSISGEAAAIKRPSLFSAEVTRRSKKIRFRGKTPGTGGLRSRGAPGSAAAGGASARRAGWGAVALPWLGMLIPLGFWHTCLYSAGTRNRGVNPSLCCSEAENPHLVLLPG